MQNTRRINIGCGQDVRRGWDNLDSHHRPGINIVWDLRKLPIKPIKDNTYDFIYCAYVLEDFINPLPLLDELVRITKPGGKIEIRVPNEFVWGSLQHQRPFNLTAFYNYARGSNHYKCFKPGVKVKELKYIPVEFTDIQFYAYVYTRASVFILNLLGRRITDNTFIKFLFPIVNLKIILQKNRWGDEP